MKCCLYLRVSTGTQETENQLPDCMNYIQSHGWTLVETYSENESAWKRGHQVELSRLLDDVRSGKRHYDVVLCWALDRLSRQGPAAILNLVNSLALYKVKVVSIKESWTDTPSELTPLLLAITGWIAEQERHPRQDVALDRLFQAGNLALAFILGDVEHLFG